ncbi:cyclic nucleotide-binding domain-containing protein [bacterium]|jgi:CRP-like cAMP-binding protein|nr:cyclic nucleotide-binding domain-containing protein [bacterium]
MSSHDYKAFAKTLAGSSIFHNMPSEVLEDLLKAAKISDLKPGSNAMEEKLIRMPGLVVILTGKLVIKKTDKGKITEVGPGNFLGEVSLFGMSLSPSATAEVLEDSTLVIIHRDTLEKWFERFPYTEALFFRYLSTELCNRLYSTTELLAQQKK